MKTIEKSKLILISANNIYMELLNRKVIKVFWKTEAAVHGGS